MINYHYITKLKNNMIIKNYVKGSVERLVNESVRNANLEKMIKKEKYYKSNPIFRDYKARKYIEENIQTDYIKSIVPGQLVMFDYFQPKTEEDLEYYDARPCTIFFGITNTKEGPRVIGFNIHYFPPQVRYHIMSRIMSHFKNIYIKSWNEPISEGITAIDYAELKNVFKKYNIDFAVRMYIPRLMANIRPIPPAKWSKAVLTEGKFKKKSRIAIMNYWRMRSTGHFLSSLVDGKIKDTVKQYKKIRKK